MHFGYTTVERIFARVAEDLHTQLEFRSGAIVVWTYEALQHIGETHQYEDKVEKIKIENHRGILPCDFFQMRQVKFGSEFLTESISTITSTLSEHKDKGIDKNYMNIPENVYTLRNGSILTSRESGEAIIYYLAIKMDEYGNLLIPDIIEYEDAIVSFIVKKFKYSEFVSGRLDARIYELFESKWKTARNVARTMISFPSPDKMVSLGNFNHRLINDFVDHYYGYRNQSDLEKIRNP